MIYIIVEITIFLLFILIAGQSRDVSKTVSWVEVIIAFLIGVLLTTVLFCLAKKFHRYTFHSNNLFVFFCVDNLYAYIFICFIFSRKKQSSGNLEETLEMVTNQEDPLVFIVI